MRLPGRVETSVLVAAVELALVRGLRLAAERGGLSGRERPREIPVLSVRAKAIVVVALLAPRPGTFRSRYVGRLQHGRVRLVLQVDVARDEHHPRGRVLRRDSEDSRDDAIVRHGRVEPGKGALHVGLDV